jgi:hypothetical protein
MVSNHFKDSSSTGATFTIENNLFGVDPLFVNAAGGDFSLQTGSPAIDQGTNLARYDDPDGTRDDIGAVFFPRGDWAEAVTDRVMVDEGVATHLDVTANDLSNGAFSVTGVTQGKFGSAVVSGNDIEYTPHAGYYGQFDYDVVEYTVSRGGASHTGKIVVYTNPTDTAEPGPGIDGFGRQAFGAALGGERTLASTADWQLSTCSAGLEATASSDDFHFLPKRLLGNFEMTVKLADLEGPAGSLAGLMVRLGREDDSAFALIGGDSGSGFVTRHRLEEGASASSPVTAGVSSALPDKWIKLKRAGNTVTLYAGSSQGSLSQVNSVTFAGLPYELDAGLFIAGTDATALTTAEFDSTSFTLTGGDAFTSVFADDFSTDKGVWTVVNGAWAIENGAMVEDSNRTKRRLILQDPTVSLEGDYVLKARMQATDDDGMGFLLDYIDEDHHFYFEATGGNDPGALGHMVLNHRLEGTDRELAKVVGGIQQNQWYDVEITKTGGAFQIRLNDGSGWVNAFGGAVSDPAEPTGIGPGTIGFFSDTMRDAIFDDVELLVPGEPPLQTLLAEDFEDGNADGWSKSGVNSTKGDWKVISGELVQDDNAPRTWFYWNDSAALNWSDYSVTVDARATDDDQMGVLFCFQDDDNHYRLEMSQNNTSTNLADDPVTLYRVVNGNVQQVATAIYGYNQGVDLTISISTTSAGDINVTIDDGSGVVNPFGGVVNDTTFTSGSIGLYAEWQSDVFYDDITVIQD